MAKKKGTQKAATTDLPEGQKILDITPEELEQMDPKTRGKALKRGQCARTGARGP